MKTTDDDYSHRKIKGMEQKECKRHNNCFFSISGDSKCFWPPCVRVGCHTSQNSGDWEGRFADTFCGEMGDYTREDYKAFIRTEIDRAERRVKDELREKIEKLTKYGTPYASNFRGQNDWAYLCDDVLNLL